MENLKTLQNGSDIRGIALGDGKNLTSDVVDHLASAFVAWLKKAKDKEKVVVAVGMDSRITGPELREAALSGIIGQGCDAIDCGLASTPAMFMTTVDEDTRADGAIMITASHLPMNRNGMKFFSSDGGLTKSDIADVIAIAESGQAVPAPEQGHVSTMDFMSRYAGDLADSIRSATGRDRPLEGLHIIVDAGNGAGGFYATKVLEPLGADTSGSQFLEPDGHFPNHVPNPEDHDAEKSIVDAVKATGADFGIIFDTDVDRAGAVDRGGFLLNRDRLIAAMSAILLKDHPGTTIVTDSITSDSLTDFIKAHGGVHRRFKRGYRNVIDESVRLNGIGQDSQLAIETSGHAALKDNYFLDDGAYLMTRLLIELAQLRGEGKTISDLIADLKDPAESEEFRLKIDTDDFKKYGAQVLEECEHRFRDRGPEGISIAPENYEGVRVSFGPEAGNGWFLLRLSLHEPLMVLNVQSEEEGGARKIARAAYDFLLLHPALVLEPLTNYLR